MPPNHSGPTPSKFAWPQLLADKLNMECVNMSRPGAGNKEILNTLLDFKFDTNDVVVTMWSFTDRWCVFKDHKSISRLVNDSGHDLVLQYDKVFTITDLQLDFIYRANFAKMYLDNKNLKNYHLSVDPHGCCPLNIPQWNSVNLLSVSMSGLQTHTAPALDILDGNPHPGPEAHQIVALKISKEIFNAYNK